MPEISVSSGCMVKVPPHQLMVVENLISIYFIKLGYIAVGPKNLIFEPEKHFSGKYIVQNLLCFQGGEKYGGISIAICPVLKEQGIFYGIVAQVEEIKDFEVFQIQLAALFNVLEQVL